MFWEAPERDCCALHAADACPALLLEVAGPLLRVSAAASLCANRVMSEPLTPFLHVLHVRDQPAYMARLLAALRALRATVDGLVAHYSARVAQLPPASDGRTLQARDARIMLPYPLRDAAQFRDAELLCDDKLLFMATHVPSSTRVCVKFSRHAYGSGVHAAWAAAGCAPALLSHAQLPGGLHMVVIELLDFASGWQVLCALPRGADRDAAHSAALVALRRAHAQPLPCGGRGAHGDCRAVNVMVRRASAPVGDAVDPAWDVRFVDFDGAGVEGRRTYPPLMATAVRWPAGALPGEPLKQEHDLALLSAECGS